MAMVDQQIAEVKLGFLCHPKKIIGDRSARGETAASPSQKLPPTAICCHFGPQNRYERFNRYICFLAQSGRAGQPGQRYSGTTHRAKMSLGDKRSACLPGKRLRPVDPTPIV